MSNAVTSFLEERVVAGDGAEPATVAASRLAPHAQPRAIALVDELPRTATGKLQRSALQERLPS